MSGLPPFRRRLSLGAAPNPTPTIVVPARTAMPEPKKKSSPHFDGDEKNLLNFMKEFEKAALRSQLTGPEKCDQIGGYTTPECQDLWESLRDFKNRNWVAYRAMILSLYYGMPSVAILLEFPKTLLSQDMFPFLLKFSTSFLKILIFSSKVTVLSQLLQIIPHLNLITTLIPETVFSCAPHISASTFFTKIFP